MRKTMFDDCKGEKLQDLLASFSTLVLQKVLTDVKGGTASIASRFAVAKRFTEEEHRSLLPLAIAHRASLQAILRRKRDLRTRYQGFGEILNSKEQELDQKFAAIVKTQEFLDVNPIPDHIVSRVSKLLEKHWRGDERLLDTIMRGKEPGLNDSLLDRPFSKTWSEISEVACNEPTELRAHGLLEDLENRVASQEARLKQWEEFKEAMRSDFKPPANQNRPSPTMTRARKHDPDLQKQRDLVFSPRKSPRKSGWGMQIDENRMSSLPPMPTTSDNDQLLSSPLSKKTIISTHGDASSRAVGDKETRRTSLASDQSPLDQSDQSGFSEISNGNMQYMNLSNGTGPYQDSSPLAAYAQNRNVNGSSRKDSATADSISPESSNIIRERTKPDEDELLADQIISMTLNAAPTPVKPKFSLMERTRQSIMASSTPTHLQIFTQEEEESLPRQSLPNISETHQPPNLDHDDYHPPQTLVDRTRQSISLIPPSKQHPSRQYDRRISKIYPTNQFETPRKQVQARQIKEIKTPPEDLFSPEAGYESVFKSRPKVGASPIASPEEQGSPTGDRG